MQTKVLIIAVIKKDNAVLMRKKPNDSPPYKETWYLFGAEAVAEKSPEQALKEHVKRQTGIDITVTQNLSWDTEVKYDIDGVQKFFIYLDVLCEYQGGKLTLSPGIEKLEWIEVEKLATYDLVPPTRKLFHKLGYISAE